MDHTTASGMKASYVAAKIRSSVEYYTKDFVLGSPFFVGATYLHTLLPSLYFWLMAKRANSNKQTLKKD